MENDSETVIVKNDKNTAVAKIVLIVMGIIFFLAGIGIGIFTVHKINDYKEHNKTYTEIVSKVVNYKYNDEHTLRAIIIEYEVDGTTYQKASNTYSKFPKKIGTEVKIKYNPSNPKEMIWSNDSDNIVLPIVSVAITLIGVFLIALGIKIPKDVEVVVSTANKEDGLYTSPELEKIKEENQDILNDTDNNTVN